MRNQDLPPTQLAKASKKIDIFVNKPPKDATAAPCATPGEPTLNFLALEIRAICVSTQNIEHKTKEMKSKLSKKKCKSYESTSMIWITEDSDAMLKSWEYWS